MIDRIERHLGTAALGVFLLALGIAALGPVAERGLLVAAVFCTLVSIIQERWRRVAVRIALALAAAALVSLAHHLATDQFGYKYVWLLSAPELPLHLKLSNVWGGDEGTLLFLSVMAFGFADRLSRRPGWAGPARSSSHASFSPAP